VGVAEGQRWEDGWKEKVDRWTDIW